MRPISIFLTAQQNRMFEMRPGSSSSLGLSQLKTFATRDAMMQHTQGDAEGTLMYVSATGSLFLKVLQGWKEIQVSLREEQTSVSVGLELEHDE